MPDDLIARLRFQAQFGTPMAKLLREAADELEGLQRHVDRLIDIGNRLVHERNEALNQRLSEDAVGYICATCGIPVESEPCPEHSPISRAEILDTSL